jgi:hypothetical protein
MTNEMNETIRVRGTKERLEQLAAAVRANPVQGIDVTSPRPAKGTLLGRAPLGQVGLFEILISVAASMISSAAYDGIKRLIAGFSKSDQVEVVPMAQESAPKPKGKSAHTKVKTNKNSNTTKRRKK